MQILTDQNEADQEKLKEYEGIKDSDFEAIDENKLVHDLNNLKQLMSSCKEL